MSAHINFILWIAVIGLLGIAALFFVTGIFDNDFAQIAANSDEYLQTTDELKASAKSNFHFATIAFLVAVSLLIFSTIYKKKTNHD